MQATTAIAIHGAGGGAWEYDLWRPILTGAGWRVVARDLMPGAGGLAQTTFEDYMRQVVESCPRTGRIVLIGASMGGILALKAAEQVAPACIVLVSSVPPLEAVPPHTVKPYPPVVQWANGPIKDTRDAMPDSDEATIQKAWKRWRDESGRVMGSINAGIPTRKPRCPALCVLAEKDTDVPLASGQALARWAGADTHLYAGMSHVGPLLSTRAPEVARATVQWCQARLC